jgi:hypothetical protein
VLLRRSRGSRSTRGRATRGSATRGTGRRGSPRRARSVRPAVSRGLLPPRLDVPPRPRAIPGVSPVAAPVRSRRARLRRRPVARRTGVRAEHAGPVTGPGARGIAGAVRERAIARISVVAGRRPSVRREQACVGTGPGASRRQPVRPGQTSAGISVLAGRRPSVRREQACAGTGPRASRRQPVRPGQTSAGISRWASVRAEQVHACIGPGTGRRISVQPASPRHRRVRLRAGRPARLGKSSRLAIRGRAVGPRTEFRAGLPLAIEAVGAQASPVCAARLKQAGPRPTKASYAQPGPGHTRLRPVGVSHAGPGRAGLRGPRLEQARQPPGGLVRLRAGLSRPGSIRPRSGGEGGSRPAAIRPVRAQPGQVAGPADIRAIRRPLTVRPSAA